MKKGKKRLLLGWICLLLSLCMVTVASAETDGTPIQPWLSKPMAELPTKGAIGLQGKHGGACPYFRNVRILERGK